MKYTKRPPAKKSQENKYQPFGVQKYARIDGLVAGSSFTNILSDMGKISSGLAHNIELDGPIAGYFLRYYIDYYQKVYKNHQNKNIPSYIVNFCQAFDTVVITTIAPTGDGRYGLTASEMNSLVNIPLTEKDIKERYSTYANGRYKNSTNLWRTKLDEMSSKKGYTIISDATRFAFIIGQEHAYANFTQTNPNDINATIMAKEMLDQYKSKLTERHMTVTLEDWTIAFRRGFIKLWEALIRRDVTILKIQEKVGNRPIPTRYFEPLESIQI
ncbi:MAG TPA: hypothetical protein VGL94_21380 [Ktedonobacteraceae bacterium]|jgi:hypothetical protein